MTATQKYLLKLLLEIDEICKKYDIEYVIDYGTTLGAVRHEGFIPWDDDIDIMLTEDNYYKWVEACKKELDPTKRVYCDGRLNREYPCVFGRYLDVESARIGRTSFFWEPICGQGIDVFVLLPLPGDPVKKQEAIDLYFAYDEFSNGSYRHFRFKTEKWMKMINQFREEEKKVGKEAVLQRLEKKIFHQHYEDSDSYIVNSARKSGPTSIVPKYCYDSVVMADFEGHKLPIAGKYIDLMNVYYEDTYCMIPPEPKHHVQMSHTGYGCKLYVDDYMRFFKKEDLLKALENTKYADVEEGYRRTKLHKNLYHKVGELVRYKLEQRIEGKINLKEYMIPDQPEKLKILDNIFSEYYNKQMNKSVRIWECYFDIGDEFLEAALFNLLYYRNDYYSIAKILYLRETAGLPKTQLMEEIWDCIQTVRRIKAETIYGNFEEAHKYADKGMTYYPNCKEIEISSVLLDVCEAKEDLSLLRQKVNVIYEKYKDEDQCIKAMGDIAYMEGNIPEAKKYYTYIMKKSLNGMLHLDINRKMRAIGEDIVQVKYFVDDDETAAEDENQKNEPTEVQERILSLMDEIDSICQEHNLHYILHNRTAGRAKEYGCFMKNSYQFEILMPFDDVMKFKAIIEKNYQKTRALEDFSVNTDMKQLMFRYVDKNTLFIDTPSGNYYKDCGVAITIYTTRKQMPGKTVIGTERYLQLQNNNDVKWNYSIKEFVAMQKEMTSIGQAEMAKKYNDPKLIELLKNNGNLRRGIFLNNFGKDFSAKWLLKQISKNEAKASANIKNLWYIRRNGAVIKLREDLYENPKRVSISGHEYNIAGKFEEYLQKMFGKNYKKSSLVPYRGIDEIRTMVDLHVPYEDYLSYIEKDNSSDFRSLILKWEDYNVWIKKTLTPISDVSYHMVDQMMRSVHRIDVWYRLQPKREDLKKAYEAGDLDQLRKLMSEYLQKTNRYYKAKVGFYIDEELFEYAKAIWKADGKENYADKVYALVPEIYRTERVDEWVSKYYDL